MESIRTLTFTLCVVTIAFARAGAQYTSFTGSDPPTETISETTGSSRLENGIKAFSGNAQPTLVHVYETSALTLSFDPKSGRTTTIWTQTFPVYYNSDSSATMAQNFSDVFTNMDFITSHGYYLKNQETVPTWVRIFDRVQLFFTVLGFVVNIITLVTLMKNFEGFSRVILVLLRHQSLIDSWVCGMATIVLLQPTGWQSGYYYLDLVLCHVWYGQAFYWGAVTLSTFNLVLIAVERYIAVAKPFQYVVLIAMSRKKFALMFLFLYCLTLFVTHGTYIQTRFEGGQCLNQYAFSGPSVEIYFFAFVIFTYLTTYALPAAIMSTLYGLVSYKLHTRGRDNALGKSKVVDRASRQLTKTAIVVTVIFLVSIGYDLHYYLLGYTGVVSYQLNTPIQKTGVFLSNLNSALNPIVYALLLPLYRRSVLTTFCCCGYDKGLDKDSRSGNTLMMSTITLGGCTSMDTITGVHPEANSEN